MTRRQPLDRQRGFTLVEIMVVVIILGILATLAFVNVPKQLLKARNKTTQSQCRELEEAITTYVNDHPALDMSMNEEIWDRLIQEGELKDKKPPKDAWGQIFKVHKRDDGEVEVYSTGADRSDQTDDDVFRDGLRKDRNQGF